MENQDKHRLRYNRCALKDIEPDDVKDHLIEKGIFSPQEMDTILVSQPTPKDRMGSLLTKMEDKGQHAYRQFQSVLLEFPSYAHLVRRLANTPPSEGMEEGDGAPAGGVPAGGAPAGGAPAWRQPGDLTTIYKVDISGKGHTTVIGGRGNTFNGVL